MSRSDAEALLAKLRVEIHDGRYSPKVAKAYLGGEAEVDVRLTIEDVGKALVKEFKADPSRRPHRGVALEVQLAAICRTPIPAAQGTTVRFGDIPMTELRTPHIEAFRDARRQLMQTKEAERLDRVAKLAQGVPTSALPAVSSELPHRRGGEIGINRHLEVIRRVVSFAILRGHYEHESPFLRHGKSIVRFAPKSLGPAGYFRARRNDCFGRPRGTSRLS